MKQFVCLIFTLTLLSCVEKDKKTIETLQEKARRIHEEVITIDTHNDINIKNFTDSIYYTQRLETQVNLPKMKEGGLDVSWLIVYTGQDTLSAVGYKKVKQNAMQKFNAIHNLCEIYAPHDIELALNSADVRKIVASGKKVAMIGVENA